MNNLRRRAFRPLVVCALATVPALALVISCTDSAERAEPTASPPATARGRATPSPTPTPTLAPAPALNASVEEVDFGRLCALECDQTVEFTLVGTGSPIAIADDGGVVIEDDRAFSATSDCEGVTLRFDGEACTVRLRFRPRTRGEYSTRLRVRHSAPSSPLTIAVSGVGVCSEAVPGDRLRLLDERLGFGRKATGGADGCLYRVRNANDSGPGSLRYGAEAGGQWIVFDEDFTIALESNIMVAGDTTIDGRGRGVVLDGRGVHLEGAAASNVILESLRIQHAAGGDPHTGNDLVRAWLGASDFWFNHLTLADARDEYIDIGHTEEGRTEPVYGTISWVRFDPGGPISDDEKAIVIGSAAGVRTNALLHVTLHHNYYNGTRQRHPLASGAYVHSFNNLIRWRLWGVQARRDEGGERGATVISEHDVFDAADAYDGNSNGVRVIRDRNYVRVVDPFLLNGAAVRESNAENASHPRDFYPYSLDPVDSVVALVKGGAGTR